MLQVTLDRPTAGNAINTRMGEELLALWLSLTKDAQELHCVVLTGAGDKTFCAGGDLKERDGMSHKHSTRQHEILERVDVALTELPLPIIAAVNGHAFGGRLEAALACDFIHTSRAARFALPEVTLGIMPGMGGTQNLPRALGDRRANELLMTGQPLSAQDAFDWGLVNRLADVPKLLEGALATARAVPTNAPLSLRQIKKSVRHGRQMDLLTAYRFKVETYNALVYTEDRREGVAAFNERRPPILRGP